MSSAATMPAVARTTASLAKVAMPQEDQLLLRAVYHYFSFQAQKAGNAPSNPYTAMAASMRRLFPTIQTPNDGMPLLCALWKNREGLKVYPPQQKQPPMNSKRNSLQPIHDYSSDNRSKKHRGNPENSLLTTERTAPLAASVTAASDPRPTGDTVRRRNSCAPPSQPAAGATNRPHTSMTTVDHNTTRLQSRQNTNRVLPTGNATDHLKISPSAANAVSTRPQPRTPASNDLPTWEGRIAELKDFAAGHGHCRVPTTLSALGRWVGALRKEKKAVDENPAYALVPDDCTPATIVQLNKARIAQLDELGFDWNVSRPPTVTWRARYQQLVEYKERFGDTRVPYEWKDNPQLAEWIHTQRNNYRKKVLAADRVDLLEKIGFEWSLREIYTFEERLEQCKAFRREHGHLTVPAPEWGSGRKQGNTSATTSSFRAWAWRMRLELSRSKQGFQTRLTSGRIKQLNEIGFDWGDASRPVGGFKTRWEQRFWELQQYKQRHGHCNVPKGSPLGSWVSRQRTVNRKNIILPERAEKLMAIGFDFGKHKKFDEYFSELEEFKQRHGHCDVPKKYLENESLGLWVHTQRNFFKHNALSPEHKEKLNAIGFTWLFEKPQTSMDVDDDELEELSHASL